MIARKKAEGALARIQAKGDDERALKGVEILANAQRGMRPAKGELPEQPFDRLLLTWSKLYRRTRSTYLGAGGGFRATLLSSPRTLSSISLLENEIEYTPMQEELFWVARGLERPEHFHLIRRFASTLFHEQNHRLLWALLPPPERGKGSVRRYLNFCEATVVALDQALGDELGSRISWPLYACGSTYDRGSDALFSIDKKDYRRYLQASALTTWLLLEGYEPKRILPTIISSFPDLGTWAAHAARRSLELDSGFVERTNPFWQEKHWKKVEDALHLRARARKRREVVALPETSELPEILLGMWEMTFRWFRL